MKKYKIKMTVLFFMLLIPFITFGQDKIEPPEPPEYEFDFDFEHFPGISKEEEKKLLKNLKADLQKELQIIKNFNEDKYFDFLRESQFRNIRMPFLVKREKDLHERENKMFEAEIKVEALAAKHEKAIQSEKGKIKTQLRKQLNELFFQKEKLRQQEVADLQKELIQLQKTLAARQNNKKQIIERRLHDLLNEEEYLDWD